ncbi:uncharacterized protein LOC143895553 [Temnothorax americanus]|uniref:uncharacterized protein LOC143895553 n=1 Tax=Temnothorax americanus TaxID=1964332 RepID=UPI0040686123
MAKTDITEASNSYSDDGEEEEYVSSEVHKALKEEVTKLHERNMDYMQIIEVLKKDALQNEEHWKKKYNNVQQQNEELITKIKLLSDLNFELQVQLNNLRKEISSLSTDTVKNITHSNPPDIDQGMMLSPFENNVEIIESTPPSNCLISIVATQNVSEVQQEPSNTDDGVNDDYRPNAFAESDPSCSHPPNKIKLISKEQFLAANKNLSDGKNHDSRFIKTISEIEWTKSEMEKRTAKTSKNCNALPMCTPEKLDYLKTLLDERMDMEKVPPDTKERDKRKLEVANYLCDKFSTIRRDKKKRLKQDNKENN